MDHNNPMIMVKSAYRSVNANAAVQKASTPSLHPQKSNHLSCKTNPFHLRIIKKWLVARRLRNSTSLERTCSTQPSQTIGEQNGSGKQE